MIIHVSYSLICFINDDGLNYRSSPQKDGNFLTLKALTDAKRPTLNIPMLSQIIFSSFVITRIVTLCIYKYVL